MCKTTKTKQEAGEKAQFLRVHIALAEDPTLVPSTHFGWLTTAYQSIFRGSDMFFWPLHVPALICRFTQIHTHFLKSKNKSKPTKQQQKNQVTTTTKTQKKNRTADIRLDRWPFSNTCPDNYSTTNSAHSITNPLALIPRARTAQQGDAVLHSTLLSFRPSGLSIAAENLPGSLSESRKPSICLSR